jgi:hypothetical protein
LTRFTTTLDTGLNGLAGEVTGATGVAVCIIISALDVTSPLVAVDEDDSVEAGVVARPANTRGLDSQAVRDGAFTTTSLAATVLLGSTFFETAVGEDADELAVRLADVDDLPRMDVDDDPPGTDVDDDPLGTDVVGGSDASAPVVSPVLCVAVDCLPPAVPALPDVLELVCAPPVLTTTPGGADLVDCGDVEAAFDADPGDVLVLVDESAEVCVDPGAIDEPGAFEAADAPPFGDPLAVESGVDDEFEVDADDVDDGPAVSDSADATPYPVRTAVPTPRATASPPTRPIYRAAPIASSWGRRPDRGKL